MTCSISLAIAGTARAASAPACCSYILFATAAGVLAAALEWQGDNCCRQAAGASRAARRITLLQALNELRMQPQEQQTARSIVVSLLSHCHDLLGSQAQTSSRSQALFEAIRQYMDIHYAEPLSRESVAQAFYLSPNYLSHLFQKCGPMGFNEYLNHIRLEQARMLLKGHDMKVKDIAHACGFADSNYFCRLFRKTTERSPSEYRRQYHSQLTEKASPVKN